MGVVITTIAILVVIILALAVYCYVLSNKTKGKRSAPVLTLLKPRVIRTLVRYPRQAVFLR